MTTTASGPITTAESLLKTALSGLASFQSWVGETTAAAAADHIHEEGLPPDELWSDTHTIERLIAWRPCALIWTAETGGFTSLRIAAPSGHTASGVLIVRLENNVPAAVRHDYGEVDRLFKNDVGDIINDLMSDTTLPLTRVDFSGPTRSHPSEVPTVGDAQACELTVHWGVTT